MHLCPPFGCPPLRPFSHRRHQEEEEARQGARPVTAVRGSEADPSHQWRPSIYSPVGPAYTAAAKRGPPTDGHRCASHAHRSSHQPCTAAPWIRECSGEAITSVSRWLKSAPWGAGTVFTWHCVSITSLAIQAWQRSVECRGTDCLCSRAQARTT